jgi:uncharacterized repeat protein (TIGR02543 family)
LEFLLNHTPTDDDHYTTGETANTGKKYGDTIADFTPPTREGYTFKGWNTARDGSGTTYVPGTSVIDVDGGTLTLYAQWETNTNNISYEYTGTVPAGAPAVPATETDVPYGTLKTVATAPTLTGYEFSGWATSDVTVIGGNFNMPDNSVTFKGSWTAKSVALEFLLNHTPTDDDHYTTGETANTGKKYGDTIAGFTPPTREGYTFTGWNTARDGSGTTYVPGTSVIDVDGGTLTLYAQWETNTNNISYEYTGTVPAGAPAVPATENDVPYGTLKTVATAPTLTGYEFSGWTTSDVTVSGGSFNMPDNNVTFKGSWTVKDYDYEVRYYHDTLDETNYIDHVTGSGAYGSDIPASLTVFAPIGYVTPGTRSGAVTVTEIVDRKSVV